MVLGGEQFQQVAQHVSNVVGCDAVRLFLGCAEAGLRHPLLETVIESDYHSVGSIGSLHDSALLHHERIQALCDLALQSGQIQRFKHWQRYTEDIHIQSVIIAPLERPTGVLGFLLLTDQRADAFGQGECLLLQHYLPSVAQQIEADVYRWRNASANENNTNDVRSRNTALSNDQAQAAVELSSPHDSLWLQQQEVERVNNEFIPLLSHELRNPLAAIKGYAILLRAYGVAEQDDGPKTPSLETVLQPQKQRDYLDHIIEQSRHLEVLLDDLLDISRLQAGRLFLRYQEVNVPTLCQRMVQLIQAKYSQSSTCEIICTFAPDLPTVWADPHRLQQIVSNVLDNAVKYSPHGGLIEVSGEARPLRGGTVAQTVQEISLTVCDSGIGIAPQHHHQLFQPFKRLEHALTNEIPGVGLGLYITKKLVEAMHGRIALASLAGEGTSVTITLPCTPEQTSENSKTAYSKRVALSPI